MNNVEIVLDFLRRHIALGRQVESVLADKKVDLFEGIGLATTILTTMPGVYKSLKVINDAAVALTNDERAGIVNTLELELDLQNDKVEAIVEAGIDLVLSTFKMQRAIVS